MREGAAVFRRETYVRNGSVKLRRITLQLEACSKSAGCRGRPGEICPNCHGAVLTIEELRFLQLPKVGRMREPGED